MENSEAIDALGALAQDDRLAAYRLLVQAGAEGMASGEIADALKVPATRMSFHLAGLERAGLVTTRREGRRILYSVSFVRMRSLLAFLMEDCCRGKPEFCGDLTTLTNKET
jgi:ArsR family transcriptional regulator